MSKHVSRQKNPVKNKEKCIQDLVIEDIKQRKKDGIKKYGTVLQPFNGRNSAIDLYQELIDAVQYCKQLIIERDEMVRIIKQMNIQLEECLDSLCCIGKAYRPIAEDILLQSDELLLKLGEKQ